MEFVLPEFVIVLRGYDRVTVDDLVRRGQAALDSESPTFRATVKAEIEREAASIPLKIRGYDRAEVSDYLSKMAALLEA